MIGVFSVFLFVTIFFFFLLFLKSLLKKEYCVICTSFSLTWIFLIFLYWFGYFDDLILLAILIGMTILGIYYTLEEKVGKPLLVFRLPFLLSLVTLFYSLLSFSYSLFPVFLLLAILWAMFVIVFFYQNNMALKDFTHRLIECCKRW
ncbi:hypothetical protein J4430_02250 [Candidatus Woesearchaeota archaeon]|nr:hypothetical protein [Candidatus Woesearchaeota archaeon]